MKYKITLILVFNFILDNSYAQFSIKVDEGIVAVSKQSLKFKVDVEILNDHKRNYLLFGVEKSIGYNIFDPIEYCDSNKVAALLFVLYDSSMNLIKAGISFEYREVTIDTLIDFFKAESDRYWLSRIHLKKGMQYKRAIEIDLKEYYLIGKDFYYTITYYQGRNIKNYFNLADIEEEAQKHGSNFFMGCVTSNFGKIRIE